MKKILSGILSLFLAAGLLVSGCLSAFAEEGDYIGNMQVVNCNEWVSLREQPSASSPRLVKVSLGSIVSNCRYDGDEWVYCEFDGYAGYIMAQYLEPSDGALTFNAMMVTTTPEGAPFYPTIDSTEPIDTVWPNTVVRNCHMMDNGRVYVEWGDRCGFIQSERAEVYNEMLHYPHKFVMRSNLYSGAYEGPDPVLQIDYAESFPLWQYDYTTLTYDLTYYAEPDYPRLNYVLHSEDVLGKIHLYSIELMVWDEDTGEAEFEFTLEDMQYELKPGHAITATAVMFGMTPNLAVGYEDPNGMYHFAFIEMSGEDGSLYLREF